jgi:hypothetical protein
MLKSPAFRDGILQWVSRNRSYFAFERGGSALDNLKLLKPLGELAITADTLIRLDCDTTACRDHLGWCWEQLKHGEVLVDALLIRPDLIVLSTIYSSFHSHGFRSSKLDRLLAYLKASPSALAVELPTWRRLDVCHGFERIGIGTLPDNPAAGTWLSALPEPWTITDDTAYASTHNIFYITDFGFMPERLTRDIRDYVGAWLGTWLEIYRRRTHWDLFAEFIMVAACLGIPCLPLVSELSEVQLVDGSMPGPEGAGKDFIADGMDAERVAFLKNYHTTLVSLMACVMARSARFRP